MTKIIDKNKFMNYLKITVGIFLTIAVTRFFPHPPNFTSLIAISFYIPALFGHRYIAPIILCFAITDLIIGFHGTILFTWGSVIIIGLISKYFYIKTINRIFGVLISAIIFFVITNFGVWLLGSYGYTFSGLITCYVLAIPFFTNTAISTIIYAFIIEIILSIFRRSLNKNIILK
tara:strand:+ start:2775 stop:3299 length:525 start_codon:yes stop_codon:yes gene_type:complete